MGGMVLEKKNRKPEEWEKTTRKIAKGIMSHLMEYIFLKDIN